MKSLIKAIKRWWKIKKWARAIRNQVKIEQTRDFMYKAEKVERVHQCLRDFGLTDKDMQAHCMSSLPPTRHNNVIREEIVCQ
jgi:hypothetical protein